MSFVAQPAPRTVRRGRQWPVPVPVRAVSWETRSTSLGHRARIAARRDGAGPWGGADWMRLSRTGSAQLRCECAAARAASARRITTRMSAVDPLQTAAAALSMSPVNVTDPTSYAVAFSNPARRNGPRSRWKEKDARAENSIKLCNNPAYPPSAYINVRQQKR